MKKNSQNTSIQAKANLLLIVGSLLFLISGCSTMHFHHSQGEQMQMTATQWHHTALNGMVEISRPANLQQMCAGNPWHSITIESTWINQLVPLAINNPPALSLYNPWTITAYCTFNEEQQDDLHPL